MRAREREGDVEESHLRSGRVAPTDLHKRRLTDQAQFCAPLTVRHRGSKYATGWTRDDEDKPINVQTTVQDDMQMVAEVPHNSEMEEVPHLLIFLLIYASTSATTMSFIPRSMH